MVNVGLRGYLWERKSVQHKVCCLIQDAYAQLHLQCLCNAWCCALQRCLQAAYRMKHRQYFT